MQIWTFWLRDQECNTRMIDFPKNFNEIENIDKPSMILGAYQRFSFSSEKILSSLENKQHFAVERRKLRIPHQIDSFKTIKNMSNSNILFHISGSECFW